MHKSSIMPISPVFQYNALVGQHGFDADHVSVLVGGGPEGTKSDGSEVPDYVDGAGTKNDLFNAIKNLKDKMNANEQFIFWASDHGNRERTETALNKAITDPVKQTIPPSTTSSSDPQ